MVRRFTHVLVNNYREREFVGKDKLFWMTPDFMIHKGIRRIKGKQFRYII